MATKKINNFWTSESGTCLRVFDENEESGKDIYILSRKIRRYQELRDKILDAQESNMAIRVAYVTRQRDYIRNRFINDVMVDLKDNELEETISLAELENTLNNSPAQVIDHTKEK